MIMTFFIAFILGILFITLLYPILTNLSDLICNWFEYLNYIIAKKIAKIQVDIQEYSTEDSDEDTHRMGFYPDCIG